MRAPGTEFHAPGARVIYDPVHAAMTRDAISGRDGILATERSTTFARNAGPDLSSWNRSPRRGRWQPWARKQLHGNQANQPQPVTTKVSPSVGLASRIPCEGDRGYNCECGLSVRNTVWDAGTEVLRHGYHLGVGPLDTTRTPGDSTTSPALQ